MSDWPYRCVHKHTKDMYRQLITCSTFTIRALANCNCNCGTWLSKCYLRENSTGSFFLFPSPSIIVSTCEDVFVTHQAKLSMLVEEALHYDVPCMNGTVGSWRKPINELGTNVKVDTVARLNPLTNWPFAWLPRLVHEVLYWRMTVSYPQPFQECHNFHPALEKLPMQL